MEVININFDAPEPNVHHIELVLNNKPKLKQCYATLKDRSGELVISATLPYIMRACIERSLYVDNYMEMVLKMLDFYKLT